MTEVNLDQDKRNGRRTDDDDVTHGKSSDVTQGTVNDVTQGKSNDVTQDQTIDVTQGTINDVTQVTVNELTQDSSNDVTLDKTSDVTRRLESGVLETDFDFENAQVPKMSEQVSISTTVFMTILPKSKIVLKSK